MYGQASVYISIFAMMSFTYLPQIYTSRRQRKNENIGKLTYEGYYQPRSGSTIDTFIFTDYNIIHYYGL